MEKSNLALRAMSLSMALGLTAFSHQTLGKAAAVATPYGTDARTPASSPASTATSGEAVNADADNSKMNQLYDGKKEATADQQSNLKADVEIITKIRRALMDNKALSTYAHNVKILADDGHVTLKGPVRSAEEKKTVEGAASKQVGKQRVKSELQITTN